ncbi:hypothetical protein VTO73DRAFT_5775 [Trametes versicolor]
MFCVPLLFLLSVFAGALPAAADRTGRTTVHTHSPSYYFLAVLPLPATSVFAAASPPACAPPARDGSCSPLPTIFRFRSAAKAENVAESTGGGGVRDVGEAGNQSCCAASGIQWAVRVCMGTGVCVGGLEGECSCCGLATRLRMEPGRVGAGVERS